MVGMGRNNYLRNCSPAWIRCCWACCTHSKWIHFHYICQEKEKQSILHDFEFKAQQAHRETPFENGYSLVCCATHDSKLFHGINWFKRCLLLNSHCWGTLQVLEILVGGFSLPVHMYAKWAFICTKVFYQAVETSILYLKDRKVT